MCHRKGCVPRTHSDSFAFSPATACQCSLQPALSADSTWKSEQPQFSGIKLYRVVTLDVDAEAGPRGMLGSVLRERSFSRGGNSLGCSCLRSAGTAYWECHTVLYRLINSPRDATKAEERHYFFCRDFCLFDYRTTVEGCSPGCCPGPAQTQRAIPSRGQNPSAARIA